MTLPPILDIVQIASLDAADAFAKMLEWKQKGGVFWNYNYANSVLPLAVTGEIGIDAALRGCSKIPTETGRRANREVIHFIFGKLQGKYPQVFKLGRHPYQIRADMVAKIHIPCFAVTNGKPKILMIQPRKSANPSVEELGVLRFIAVDALGKTYFDAPPEFEILDLSAQSGTDRQPRLLDCRDLPSFSREQIDQRLQNFADAHEAASKINDEIPEKTVTKEAQIYRKINQGDLFQ